MARRVADNGIEFGAAAGIGRHIPTDADHAIAMDGPKFAVLSTSDGPTPKRLAGRIRVWNDRRRSSHRSRGTPPSGVRAANDIFSLRHRHQSLRQRLLLGRIAPLHDIIVLHAVDARPVPPVCGGRSEEHTSELQSLMRISYAVFCLKKKTTQTPTNNTTKHN